MLVRQEISLRHFSVTFHNQSTMIRVVIENSLFPLILLKIVLDFGIGVSAIEPKLNNDNDETFPAKLSEENKSEILRLFNQYRSSADPPAADMRLMAWDLEAEEAALHWAKSCRLTPGMPGEYEQMGQSLYVGHDDAGIEAVRFWWLAVEKYNFSTYKCMPDTKDHCRSYTQILWAKNDRVGCGVNSCLRWNLTVCYYRPGGDYRKEHPYEVGNPCSQCDSDGGSWCYQNLCVTQEECKSLGLKCKCSLQCRNCGVLDKENCRCKCKGGWDSPDCSKPCENSNSSYCHQDPEVLSKTTCLQDVKIKNKYCRASCNQCNPTPDGDPKFTFDPKIPDGVSCPDGYSYNKDVCECTGSKLIDSASTSVTDISSSSSCLDGILLYVVKLFL